MQYSPVTLGRQIIEEEHRHHPTSGELSRLLAGRKGHRSAFLKTPPDVVFLVAGAAKAKVIGEIFGKNPSGDRYPVQSIRPSMGHTLWLLDRAAAS